MIIHWCDVCKQSAGGSFSLFSRVFGDCWFSFVFVRMWIWLLRPLVHVLCACRSFALSFDIIRLSMMWWEISRPPGPPNHVFLRPPMPILPRVVVIAHQCTHPHPSAPIRTHLHPSAPIHVWIILPLSP